MNVNGLNGMQQATVRNYVTDKGGFDKITKKDIQNLTYIADADKDSIIKFLDPDAEITEDKTVGNTKQLIANITKLEKSCAGKDEVIESYKAQIAKASEGSEKEVIDALKRDNEALKKKVVSLEEAAKPKAKA